MELIRSQTGAAILLSHIMEVIQAAPALALSLAGGGVRLVALGIEEQALPKGLGCNGWAREADSGAEHARLITDSILHHFLSDVSRRSRVPPLTSQSGDQAPPGPSSVSSRRHRPYQRSAMNPHRVTASAMSIWP